MQNSVVNQPVMGQSSYVLQHPVNPELVVNKYDLRNQVQPMVMPQAPVLTFQQPYKYPVTYKMGPPKIRPPTKIHEETLIQRAPIQQVISQPFIQNQQMLVQQPVTQMVPQPVSQQFIVPQAVPAMPAGIPAMPSAMPGMPLGPMDYQPQLMPGNPVYY